MTRKLYIFYLTDTVTGNCYYLDSSGNIQLTSIVAAGIDVSMKNAPDGWMGSTLGYSRNKTYYGFNRSYSDQIKLVKDAAYIVRSKFYLENGVESQLTLVILKFNSQPQAGEPQYKLYYKGPIDMSQKNDKVGEGVGVNLLEGGILQLLKTYDKKIISIPCDGSIPENIKVNMDGMYFQDTFNYQILPAIMPDPRARAAINVFPTAFISHDGDNIGVIHQDTLLSGMDDPLNIPAYTQAGLNYTFSNIRPTTVIIQGYINVVPVNGVTRFGLSYYTDQSQVVSGNYTHAGSLIGNNNVDGYSIIVQGTQSVYFYRAISLAANEKLFLMAFGSFGPKQIRILSGSFTMKFASIAADTSIWGITGYDLFRLLIQNICKSASTQFQNFSFGADSALLQSKLNLVCTSGDAIRASGDPNYQKFYNAIQNNPNFPNLNNYYSFGPVIKTTLSDFFTSFNAILGGALGSQTLAGEGETVFFEPKGYVFNNASDTFDLGEVSDFSVSVDTEKLFNILKIGYQEQQYDQKSGKYEWNTSLQMVSPIRSITSKTLELTSVYRADPYGIERLRANIDSTSHTKNTSDNSVFILNSDSSSFIYDYFETNFTSAVSDPTINSNTNIKLLSSQLNQGLGMNVLRTGYFSVNNDPSIIVLSEYPLSSSKTLAINISGSLNGSPYNALTNTPADTATINIFVNGVILKTYLITSTSPSTSLSIVNDTITRVWNTNDNIYAQTNTSANGVLQIDTIDLNMSAGYFEAIGLNISVEGGASNKMISFTSIPPPANFVTFPLQSLPVISYGFQYFQFNSLPAQKNFNTVFSFSGSVTGTASPGIAVSLYLNGAVANSLSQNIVGGWQPFGGSFNFTRDWALGDVMFALGSNYYGLTTEFQSIDLKISSTQIKARALKRVQYDYISGIPNLTGFVKTPIVVSTLGGPVTIYVNSSIPLTTGPGAPYNIEDLTPKRMLAAHGNYLRSIFWDQAGKQLLFSTLSKNQFLITRLNGVTTTENANVNISDLTPPLFSLNKAVFKTRVPLNFDTIMRASVNAFLSWTWNGNKYYGFAEDMKQKSTLNEMQSWEVLIA